MWTHTSEVDKADKYHYTHFMDEETSKVVLSNIWLLSSRAETTRNFFCSLPPIFFMMPLERFTVVKTI